MRSARASSSSVQEIAAVVAPWKVSVNVPPLIVPRKMIACTSLRAPTMLFRVQ